VTSVVERNFGRLGATNDRLSFALPAPSMDHDNAAILGDLGRPGTKRVVSIIWSIASVAPLNASRAQWQV
jgi:hypothetical protein